MAPDLPPGAPALPWRAVGAGVGAKLVGGGIGPQGVMHPVGGSRAPGKQVPAGESIGTAMNLHVALSLNSLSGEKPLGAATVSSLAVQPSLTLCARRWSTSELPAHAAPLAWMPFSIVCLCLTKLELEVLIWEASRGEAMSSAPHPTTRQEKSASVSPSVK